MPDLMTMEGVLVVLASGLLSEDPLVHSEIVDIATHKSENTVSPQIAPMNALKEPERLVDTPPEVMEEDMVMVGLRDPNSALVVLKIGEPESGHRHRDDFPSVRLGLVEDLAVCKDIVHS